MRRRRRPLRPGAGLLVLLALPACATVGEDFVSPANRTAPGGYAMAGEQPAPRAVYEAAAAKGPWWSGFGSAELDQVIRQSLEVSPGLEEARATLERYQAAEAATRALMKPQIGINARTERQLFNSQAFGFTGFPNRTFSLFSIGGVVSYDLDLFGSNRRYAEQAGARAEKARRQADAAALTLTANVARQAVRLAGLNGEIEAAELVISDDRRLLELALKAEKLGGLSRSGVLQIEAQLARDEAQMPALLQSRDEARHQLALLAGKAPAEWTPPDFRLEQISTPAVVPVTLPSELVRRRPDILAAEADLHAVTAAAGVVLADRFPKLRLTGDFSQTSTEFDALLDSGSKGWNLGGRFSLPIYDGGLRRANSRAAEAEIRAADARYRATVLGAFTQVANLLSALKADEVEVQALERAVSLAERDASVTAAGVRLGGTPLLRAIDARRQLSLARQELAEVRARRLETLISLFAATGADWQTAADD
ncbi:MAG: efflux transporter outer membrane subunit [Phenylobacterium sp.]|nr:efflux transporter outer membrane subunit [Phenylobacterium sp.]